MRTEDDIQHAIKSIDKILRKKVIYLPANAEIREGYRKARSVLIEKNTDPDIAGINDLNSIKAKSIAKLAIDYLNGDTSIKIMCSVKINLY
jgi:uncharacterized protein YdaT